jgi:hypothetical protein
MTAFEVLQSEAMLPEQRGVQRGLLGRLRAAIIAAKDSGFTPSASRGRLSPASRFNNRSARSPIGPSGSSGRATSMSLRGDLMGKDMMG